MSVRLHHYYSRAPKAPDHDRRRRRRQRPRTAAMVGLLSPRRVDSIEDMRQHKSSRVGGQKRRFGCAPRLCMASRAHAVESRREGLHDGSRRSRRRWRLQIRSPRLRLMVFDYSYDTATSTFKLVVLAIGLAASDPATRAGSDETMAVSEALADD